MVPTIMPEASNIIVYSVCVLLGIAIHNSCIFLIVLLVVVFFKKINVPKTLIISIVGMGTLAVLLPLIPKIASHYLNAFYIQRYFLDSPSKTTISRLIKILLVWIMNVSLAILVMYSVPHIKENGLKNVDNSQRMLSRCFSGICILSICIPMLIFDENFHRYFEIGFMLLYVMYGGIKKKIINNKVNKVLILGFILISIGFCIYVYYPFESIVIPLFKFDGFAKIIR